MKPSKIRGGGVGLFAATSIKKGEVVEEGTTGRYSELVPWSELKKQPPIIRKLVKDFCIGIPAGFCPPDDLNFNHTPISWYFNHSCDNNLGFSKKGDFVATRNIKKGEELTYDYGLAESNPTFKMKCLCRTKKCRKIITGKDWKNKEYQKKNSEYFLPLLRELINASR
jgi:SET domain-containing protein